MSLIMGVRSLARHVIVVVVVVWLCSLMDTKAHMTVSQMHYSHQVDCGLKQGRYYTERWWEPISTCKFSISCDPNAKYRTADGSCNNLRNPQWGAALWPYDRFLPPKYEDSKWYPRSFGSDGYDLPSPRLVSTSIHTSDSDQTLLSDVSNLFQVWGQFLDHDLTMTPQMKVIDGKTVVCCDEQEKENGPRRYRGGPCFNIPIPSCDHYMSRRCMSLTRSQIASREKSCGKRYKEQLNSATVYVDASQVYGSSDQKMADLREHAGGRLRTKMNNLLPETSDPLNCFKVIPTDFCLKAGDPRANEHPGLAVLHVAFLREHNRIAGQLAALNSHWNDERIYQEARKIVAAQMQVITFWEWLPPLLGPEMMSFFELDLTLPFSYRPDTNPTAFNSFATAAFRYGHSQIIEKWTVGMEKISLDVMFNRPFFVQQDNGGGYDKLLSGMATDASQKVDILFSNGVVDHLFEKTDKPALDLVSLNLQRGRDHGLPPYRYFKRKCSRVLGKRPKWTKEVFKKILRTYRTFENVDLFSGALAELHLPGAQVGPTFACIIGLFFHKVKYGDRFWFQTDDERIGFTEDQLKEIIKITMSRVICDNSETTSIQRKAFMLESASNQVVDCAEIPSIDLTKWVESPPPQP